MDFDEYDETPIDVPGGVVLHTSDIDDWFTIEHAVHEGKHAMEQIPGMRGIRLTYTGRISDADVEGTAADMRAIAAAIRERGEYITKRCMVDATGERALFSSPRNSMRSASVSLDAADTLATQIETELGHGE